MKIDFHPGLASFLGAIIIRIFGSSWRIQWKGIENLEKARSASGNVIFAFWHGRLLVLSYTHRKRNIQVLASYHRDGDLMGRTIARLGFGHRKGSSSRGGASALRDLAKLLRSGLDVGLTIDGPRGPRGSAQQGAIELGRMTAKAIVPVSNSARPRRLFRSWDRFQLPLPFARVLVSYGEPLIVPQDTNTEERGMLRRRLEEELDSLTASLDRELGYEGLKVWPHGSD